MKLVVLALIVLTVGCGPHGPPITTRTVAPIDELPPPNKRVETTTEDARACARITSFGCPEAPKCMAIISDARTDHVVIPSTCIADAADVAAVRRCGDKSTLVFDCEGR